MFVFNNYILRFYTKRLFIPNIFKNRQFRCIYFKLFSLDEMQHLYILFVHLFIYFCKWCYIKHKVKIVVSCLSIHNCGLKYNKLFYLCVLIFIQNKKYIKTKIFGTHEYI